MTSDATADRLNSEGLAFLSAREGAAARRAYRQALSFAPAFVAALGNLANLDAQEERIPPALLGYRRALAVAPGLAGLHLMLGTTLLRVGKDDAGERSLGTALKINPGYPKAHLNLGIHAHRRRRLAEAERHFRLAVKGDPAADSALSGLARVLSERAGSREARSVARRAVVLAPASSAALSALGQVIFASGYVQTATQLSRRVLATTPDADALKALMFCLHYNPDGRSDEIFSLHRRWAMLQTPPAPRSHRNTVDSERRLRVGYLSADLYDHPVGRTVVGLIEQHNPDCVEAHIYAERVVSDGMTERIRTAARGWRETLDKDDLAVAKMIKDDNIDVLVILAGHTLFNRITVAALKPAPVQASLYDFSTSGLTQIDGFLGDAVLTPQAGEERFSENLVTLPCFYLQPPLDEVPISATPKSTLVFGSCSNPAKINDHVIGLWARVLNAAPESQLYLKYRDSFSDPDLVNDIGNRFHVHGVTADRLIFDGRRVDRSTHLSTVGAFDIALDPFPFNGCTTTYEALWMGVPVVTLAGCRAVGRMSAAILHQVGLDEFVVATEDEYIATVVRLAKDASRRARLRLALREHLKASRLLNATAYARSIENAYRELWRSWCGSTLNTGGRKSTNILA